MAIFDAYFNKVKTAISNTFTRYGELVGRHPVPFIVLPILIFGSLGAGLIALDTETDLETIYFPDNSRAMQDRQTVRDLFPDLRKVSYNPFSLSDTDNAASLIFKTKGDLNLFESSVITEILAIVESIEHLNSSGQTFSDHCAKFLDSCVVQGKRILSSNFQNDVNANIVTYPIFNGHDLSTILSGVTLIGDKVVSATVLKVSFNLADDARDWKKAFVEFAGNLNVTSADVAYAIPESLSDELDKSTQGDTLFFSLTITIVCVYASLVCSGGNPVSTRGMLAYGGILAAGLGILGSMGLLSACGVKFVNIVGVVPFLIIGIGVDDMFLMMSAWSDSVPDDPEQQTVRQVPRMIGRTLASAGVGISITSITDLLAFLIGTTSVFKSVTYFSLYAGVAVLFCYLANITLFSGCLAVHGRRVYSWRHHASCAVTKSREDLQKEGRSACFICLCGGNPPTKKRDDESICEMLPSKFLPKLFRNTIVCIVIILLFLVYLGISIYGVVNLKQGLILQNLVLDSSNYHTFLTFSDEYFPVKIPVGFIVDKPLDYSGHDGVTFKALLQQAKADSDIDSKFERCWLMSYQSHAAFNAANFMGNLPTFLADSPDFAADVVLDSSKTTIVASRCFVMSEESTDQYDNAQLMERMRGLADTSPVSVFAYHSSFLAFEQFVAVLPATLLMVGCAVTAMTLVTFLFLPHPLMVLLVLITILMILVGIFGFLYYWDLTLSSITMIHLIMSVGFSVDFSAHVCAAYMLSNSQSRRERACDAIRHAAGPILNGAVSTLLGVMLLVFSSSFIFQSFFKVMVTVIVFGLLHAVFFLPAILSLVGPQQVPSNTTTLCMAPLDNPAASAQDGDNQDGNLCGSDNEHS